MGLSLRWKSAVSSREVSTGLSSFGDMRWDCMAEQLLGDTDLALDMIEL